MPTEALKFDGEKTNWPPAPTVTYKPDRINIYIHLIYCLRLTMIWLVEARVAPEAADAAEEVVAEGAGAGGAYPPY